MEPGELEATLEVVEAVLEELRSHQLDAVLIGALALAVHGYPRETADLDLAVATEPRMLHQIADSLRRRGLEVDVRDPDPSDPLGGVADIRSPGADLIQLVNFSNPPSGGFPRLVEDSLATSSELSPDTTLRVVDVYHLIAFKLYAGGGKSKLDILELLDRCPSLDRSQLKTLCDSYQLGSELEQILALEDE